MRPFSIAPLVLVALAIFFAPISSVATSAARKPNLIFVLVDDLGWGDVGVYFQNSREFENNRHQPAFSTPNLDTMAAEGLRMDRHYVPAPVCAPSRASLLLGVHQGHANVRDNQFDKALADNHTLASVLREAGYATAVIGKWGLQGGDGYPGHPQNRGFDFFSGYLAHLDAHFHYPKEHGRSYYEGFENIVDQLDKCYSTDLATGRAKKWIADHVEARPGQPFFLYLSYAAPHAQLNVPSMPYPEGGGLHGGVQWAGEPGAMLNTAGGEIDSWIHPDYAHATWDHDNDPATPEVEWPDTARRHATMVRRLDDAMADLFHLLRDLDLDDNTLVVFTSDNGPHNEAGAGGGQIGAQDPRFFRSYGPMDGIKRDLWEGGIRVPTLVRWPGGIPAGRVSTRSSQFHDWMNTFVELAGVPAPAVSDGVSIVPDLTGLDAAEDGVVYVEYTNGGAVRTPAYEDFHPSRHIKRGHMQVLFLDGYKGVRYNVTSYDTPFMVYDVARDPQETIDLAGRPGVPSQQDFQDRVLRTRRAYDSAPRVYDDPLIPALATDELPAALEPGLAYSVYHGDFPWVTAFTGLEPDNNGTMAAPGIPESLPDGNFGLASHGYLNVPTDGTYTFHLETDTGAFVRLHDARLIDADRGYAGGNEISSGEIHLQAGPHPIRIFSRHSTSSTPHLKLHWRGPDIPQQPVPEKHFLAPTAP